MKLSKKLLGFLLITASIFTLTVVNNTTYTHAASSVTLADFSFSKSDGADTAKDLNDTYNTKADTGYSPKSGVVTGSKLFASVADPSKADYRKLEWSNAADYSYNNSSVNMPIMAASAKNPWGTKPYFLIKTSTKGYKGISLSLILGGSKKGPAKYKIEYSTDNKNYYSLAGTDMEIKSNKKMYPFSFNLSGLDNLTTVYIRITADGTTTIEGGSFSQNTTSGETAINNIIIKGEASTSSTNESSASATKKPTESNSNNSSSNSSTAAAGTNNSSNNNNNQNNTGTSTITKKKTLAKPSLTSYKAGKKIIKGKAVKKSTVTLTVSGKTYTAKVSGKGTFRIKLSAKLKKGQKIKLYASKTNYNNSKTRKYTVK